MNKLNYLFSLTLFLLSLDLAAQSPIYNSHFFKKGIKVKYQPTKDSLITFEEEGDQLIWNYAHLPPGGDSYSRTIKATNETPYSSKFPESNFAIVGEGNDYVFLNVTHSKTEFIAFVPPDSSYFVHNYQPWSISVHPMKYKDSIQAPIARYIKVGERTVFRDGKVMTTAIAKGKLILPNKTYENVLKIKEIQTFYNPTRTTFYQATTYHWLSNECNFPILSCNEIIDRNSKGEEQVTKFAQYLLEEENTNPNVKMKAFEKDRPKGK